MIEKTIKIILYIKPSGNIQDIKYVKLHVTAIIIRVINITLFGKVEISTPRYFRTKYIFTMPSKNHGSTLIDITIVGSTFKYRSNAANGIMKRNIKLENIQGYFNFAVACTEFTIGLVNPIIKDCTIIILANSGVRLG